jgi:hypothetical protein
MASDPDILSVRLRLEIRRMLRRPSKLYSKKERAELNLLRFKQHTLILYCGYSLIKSDGCKPEDKSQSHATDSDQCLLSLELPCISLLKVYGGCL